MNVPWFKHHPGAAADAVAGLPLRHIGILYNLTNHYWLSGNRLEPDVAKLRRKVGVRTSEEVAAFDEVLAEFFPDGRNEGLDQQAGAVAQKSEVRRQAAAARWGKAEPKAIATDGDDF